MRPSRKPAVAAMVAIASLLVLSSIGTAGTTWGGRSYSLFGSSSPGTSGPVLLSAPVPSGGLASSTMLSPSGDRSPVFLRSAAPSKALLCADPCIGSRLGVDGSVSGLGSSGESIELDAETDIIISCTSPGGNQAPGRNFVAVLSGSVPYAGTEVTKNGRFYFSSGELFVGGEGSGYEIGSVPGPASEFGCPNDNWTAAVMGYQFLCAKLTAITDAGGSSSVVDRFNARCTLTA